MYLEMKMLLVIFQICLFEFNLIRTEHVYTYQKTEVDYDVSDFDYALCQV